MSRAALTHRLAALGVTSCERAIALTGAGSPSSMWCLYSAAIIRYQSRSSRAGFVRFTWSARAAKRREAGPMNDERRSAAPPATNQLWRAYQPSRRPPRLEVTVDFEGAPQVWLMADSWEDEQRLRRWLAHRATRRRLLGAVLGTLDGLEEAA